MPEINHTVAQPTPAVPATPNGSNAGTDPTYNVRMLMDAENTALKELSMSEIRHVEEMQKLHVFYQEKLIAAEAKRIDAILSANASEASTNRERASAQAQVLATQVATSAETLRQLVSSTAAAQAVSHGQTVNQLNERLASLEKFRYEDIGKARVEDPAFAMLTKKLEDLFTATSESRGRAGISSALTMILAALGGGILVFVVETLIKLGVP